MGASAVDGPSAIDDPSANDDPPGAAPRAGVTATLPSADAHGGGGWPLPDGPGRAFAMSARVDLATRSSLQPWRAAGAPAQRGVAHRAPMRHAPNPHVMRGESTVHVCGILYVDTGSGADGAADRDCENQSST